MYRIVERHGLYVVQKKILFFWIDVEIGDLTAEYETIGEAEKAIERWNKRDVVIKEIKVD